MAGRSGQTHLSTYVPEDIAQAFKVLARQTEGATSAALRRLIVEAVVDVKIKNGLHCASLVNAHLAPRGAGFGRQIGFRLRPTERLALDQAARAAGTSPANWVRSLALVHLLRRPQWHPAEVDALRDLFRELRAIGNNVNQIAHALNIAVQTGQYPQEQGVAAEEAAKLVRSEMRRIVSVMTGNYAYWGLPDTERPIAVPGAVEQENAQARAAEKKRKRKLRRRPTRFTE